MGSHATCVISNDDGRRAKPNARTRGYNVKGKPPEILKAIHAVANRGLYLGPAVG